MKRLVAVLGVASVLAACSDGPSEPSEKITDACNNPLSLAPGRVVVLSGPTAVSCITLAQSTAAAEYLFITANANPVPDDLRNYTVSLQASASASSAARTDGPALTPQLMRAVQAVGERDAAEARVRSAEQELLRTFSTRQLQQWQANAPRMSASVSVAALAVGDTLPFRVPNILGSNLCTQYTDVRGVVKALGQKVQIAQDVNAPGGGLSDADFAAIANEFDNLIYRTDTLWFGSPTDINADGRITILYTPEVNKFTSQGSTGYVGGFFWGGDLFKRTEFPASTPCPQTNEQEIFYLLAPDPTGAINGNVRSTALVRRSTRGTIAHELQHMINQGVRQVNPAVDSLETFWLNEGLAHFAEEVIGRASRGFSENQSLSFSDVRANAEDYDAFFVQNLVRFAYWLQRPDTSSPTSAKAEDQLAPRGAAWALVRYVADQHSGGNARTLVKRLVAGPEINVKNLELRTGSTFDAIIQGWLIANYADNLNIPGLDGRYSYTSWNMRDAVTGAMGGQNYPLLVQGLAAPVTTKALSGSGNYFRVPRAAGAPPATFRMQAPGGNANVDFNAARVYVVRLN